MSSYNRSASHLILLISILLYSWTGVSAQMLPAGCLAHDSDSVSEEKITIEFRISHWDIDSAYSDNARNIHDLRRLLDEVRTNPLLSLRSFDIAGYSSPDGLLPKNKELSLRRAVSLRNYLHDKCGVPDSLMSFGESSVSWDAFRNIVAASGYAWRDEALRIMNIGSDSDAVDNTRRMNRLKRLADGEAWKTISSDILPRLRCAYVVHPILSVRQPGLEIVPVDTVAHFKESVDSGAIKEQSDTALSNSTADTATEIAASQVIIKHRNHDRFSIKTNAAYLAAGVTNIGGEMAFADHWSVDLPIVYSPYTLARTYRLRFLYTQPEARYWFDRPLKGHFFGAHINIGVANVSLDDDSRYQTPGGFYGAGISYGYSLPIAKRWSIEFTIGAGFLYTQYDTYYNIGIPNGMRYEKDRPFSYWGLDKFGINIVYRFGEKSGRGKEVEEK